MQRIDKIVGIVDGIVLAIGIVIIQLDDLVLAYRLGIGQGRTEIIGTERIVIILIERRSGIQLIKTVQRIIITIPVVLVHRPVQIERKGPEILFEFMPEGQIGTVDIVPAVAAGSSALCAVDRRSVLIDLEGIGRAVGLAGLECYIQPENK